MTATARALHRIADVEDMARHGVRSEGAAAVLGWSKRTLRRYLDRHDRYDLWAALVTNDRRPNRWDTP